MFTHESTEVVSISSVDAYLHGNLQKKTLEEFFFNYTVVLYHCISYVYTYYALREPYRILENYAGVQPI